MVSEERNHWARDIERILVTREVVAEVRKRSGNLGANRFIDLCREKNRILSRDGCPFKHALDFLLACAMRLPPIVEASMKKEFELHGVPVDLGNRRELVNRVLQRIVNEEPSLFGTPEYRNELVQRGFLPDLDLAVSSSLKKSWFSYLPKRMKKKSEGPYLYTDEKIAALATVNSLLVERPSIIVSSDYDYAAIFKQLLDNVLLVASMRPNGETDDAVFQSLVHSMEDLGKRRELRQIDELFRSGNATEALAPKAGEVLLIIPRVQETLHFAFGGGFRQFVLECENRLRNDEESAKRLESFVK